MRRWREKWGAELVIALAIMVAVAGCSGIKLPGSGETPGPQSAGCLCFKTQWGAVNCSPQLFETTASNLALAQWFQSWLPVIATAAGHPEAGVIASQWQLIPCGGSAPADTEETAHFDQATAFRVSNDVEHIECLRDLVEARAIAEEAIDLNDRVVAYGRELIRRIDSQSGPGDGVLP